MAKTTNSTDIGWIIDQWANWKLCRPQTRAHEQPVHVPSVPCSKPPKNVWMTPLYQVWEYRAIDDAYESLPKDKDGSESPEHWLIRIYYLWRVRPLTKSECARAMGMHHQAWDRARLRALDMIAERVREWGT